VGRIAAGAPALADQDIEEYLAVPATFADEADHFALRVEGDSMIEAGIRDGDMVVVRRQDVAEDGSIVAALLPGPAEDEATVKRLRRTGARITLVPENAAMDPFELPEGGRILGQVVALLRKL
jgi:repressor LexA